MSIVSSSPPSIRLSFLLDLRSSTLMKKTVVPLIAWHRLRCHRRLQFTLVFCRFDRIHITRLFYKERLVKRSTARRSIQQLPATGNAADACSIYNKCNQSHIRFHRTIAFRIVQLKKHSRIVARRFYYYAALAVHMSGAPRAINLVFLHRFWRARYYRWRPTRFRSARVPSNLPNFPRDKSVRRCRARSTCCRRIKCASFFDRCLDIHTMSHCTVLHPQKIGRFVSKRVDSIPGSNRSAICLRCRAIVA